MYLCLAQTNNPLRWFFVLGSIFVRRVAREYLDNYCYLPKELRSHALGDADPLT